MDPWSNDKEDRSRETIWRPDSVVNWCLHDWSLSAVLICFYWSVVIQSSSSSICCRATQKILSFRVILLKEHPSHPFDFRAYPQTRICLNCVERFHLSLGFKLPSQGRKKPYPLLLLKCVTSILKLRNLFVAKLVRTQFESAAATVNSSIVINQRLHGWSKFM